MTAAHAARRKTTQILKSKLATGCLSLVLAAVHTAALAADMILVGAFDLGPGGNPQKFNPLAASAGFTWYNKYFGTLALYDVGFEKISGDLAESWTMAPDGRLITFKLRKGVKWHDGKPFSAKDVKFTLELAKNPDSGSLFVARLDGLSHVSTPDPLTVVLTLKSPNAPILDTLTSLMMLPEHHLGGVAPKELRNADWWRRNPVGTGPFKWSRYEPDQYVELLANADYYRGRPKLDKLVNRYFKDSGAAAMALQAGEIQFSYLTLDQVKDAKASSSYRIVSGPSQVLNYLGFNNQEARFQDVRVRQAMLMALDREAIIKYLYGGQAQAGQCVYTQALFVPSDVKAYGYDPQKARQLLREAGWERIKGEPIELITYYGDQLSKDVLATIQAQLASVGVHVVPRFLDGPTFGKLVDSGKFALAFAGAGNGPEPDTLGPFMESAHTPPKGVNRMRVNLPEIDKLFDTGRQETSAAKRPAHYQSICRITNAHLPWAPLWESKRFGGIAKTVQNMVWTPAPAGGRYQDHAENWSIQRHAPQGSDKPTLALR